MLGVDFSRLHTHLAIAFILPMVFYSFLIVVAGSARRRFLWRTSPILLIYFAGCFFAYLWADPLLNILRISGSVYILASFVFLALVLLGSSIWAIRKQKRKRA